MPKDPAGHLLFLFFAALLPGGAKSPLSFRIFFIFRSSSCSSYFPCGRKRAADPGPIKISASTPGTFFPIYLWLYRSARSRDTDRDFFFLPPLLSLLWQAPRDP